MPVSRTLRLGLIGGNITESRSPALQIVCGLSVGRNVSYDLLVPAEHGLTFAEMLDHCARTGFVGVNVTYPFKEEVVRRVMPGEPVVTALGAANTVRFTPDGARCFNTDHSGFMAAYRARWGHRPPGRVLLIGAGGVGRAIAFGLAELGAEEILLHDVDSAKAEALAEAVGRHAGARLSVTGPEQLRDVTGLDGLVNGTPLGMSGKPGSPLPESVKGRPSWAFDAVYTPEHTLFRAQAEALGADFLSGYELYINQGMLGFHIFAGVEVTDQRWVRRILQGIAAPPTGITSSGP
ncbi:shikimate dehydrogenase [Aestuariivirga sp.]|uniref:shikimate dehydrogenase family protein n=1 Tax=Aestuariivirga sp. TaxID=2650926 RepID=UPI003594825B